MVTQLGSGLAALLVLDFVWLGLVMTSFYKRELGTLARRSGDALAPLWGPAVLLYVLIACGLWLFVMPRAAGTSVAQAAGWGAAFGVISFAVYDLTNYATLAGWSLRMTVVDLAWGAVLCGTASAVMFVVGR
jgi:uncharacterized membrane protein